MRTCCASLLRYSIEVVLLSMLSLTATGSCLASAADGKSAGGCGRLLTDLDATHDSAVGLSEKLNDLKKLWLSLGQVREPSARQKKEEFDRVVKGVLEDFRDSRWQIQRFVKEIVSDPAANGGLTRDEVPRLRQELEALRIRSGRLKAEGRDLAEYRIVGDSDTDPSIKWGFDEEGRDGLLEVEGGQHVEVPTGNGQVIRVDLRKEGGHTARVYGARLLPDGSILSWSYDHTLIVWKKRGTEYVQVQRLGKPRNEKDPNLGHLSEVVGALLLPDGTVRSRDSKGRVLLWQVSVPQAIADQLANLANEIEDLETRLALAEASP